MSEFHRSVLLQEAVDLLKVRAGGKYIDATLGGGGHGFKVLKQGGLLLGIDQDIDAIEFVERRWKIESRKWNIKEERLRLVRGNFKDLEKIARENGFEKVSGVLFDLGVSSHQFDEAERGFSFAKEGPLDMRMSKDLKVTAKDLVNGLTKQELEELFTRFGEERFARKIADSIVKARAEKQITTTAELAEIVKKSVYRSIYDVHPATRVFQALRIAVNDELNVLYDALPQAVRLLRDGGRLVVISFHSLEDRIVKQVFLQFAEKGYGSVLSKKPIVPSVEEIKQNPRSRSAKLRVFERR